MNTNTILSLAENDRSVNISWADGHQSIFHYLWLRDNCSKMLHQDSGQRKISSIDLPIDIRPRSVKLTENQQLEIEWAYDQHISQFEADWLRKHCYTTQTQPKRWPPKLWDASSMNNLPEANYGDICTDKAALREWLTAYRDYGFGLLHEVPVKSKMVLEVGSRLSYIWQNGLDEYFDIQIKVDPDYVAFTNLPLRSHTDHAYLEPIPPAEMLHCLANDVEGGESTLVDGFKVAAVLQEQNPTMFNLLSSYPIHYRFWGNDCDFVVETPLILTNASGEVTQIRLSNQSRQPFRVPAEVMEDFYEAYNTFSRMVEDEAYQIRISLKPGDLYMLDNYRLLHGRTGFSTGGNRHMQVCYIGRDKLFSRLNVLNRD